VCVVVAAVLLPLDQLGRQALEQHRIELRIYEITALLALGLYVIFAAVWILL
jgi:hypothetical protein